MGHAIDQTTGAAAFTYRGATAWHKLGEEAPEGSDLPQWMHASRTNYEVTKVPAFVESIREIRGADGEVIDAVTGPAQIPGGYATIRTDTGGVLGMVGERYTPLQNRDAFAVLEPLLDSGLAELETMGALHDGADVFGTVRFNLTDPRVRALDGRIMPYAIITNNHTGKHAVRMFMTMIRVVCQNTLQMATGAARNRGIVKIKHTRTVAQRTVEEAETLFNMFNGAAGETAELWARLQNRMIDAGEFRAAVLDVLSPLPDAEKYGDSPKFDSMVAKAEERRAELTALWRNGKGHTGEPSAWYAYNGAVESIDHNRDMWTAGDEFGALYGGGRLDRAKREVLDALTALV